MIYVWGVNMRKIKHNKIKNTGLLFELLLRQVSSDVMSGTTDSRALSIIREWFGKGSEIYKELELYNAILKNKFNTRRKADVLIETVLQVRKRLDNAKIRKAKYSIIKEIMKSYGVNDFFSGQVANYPEYASIYKLFESAISIDPFEPADITKAKNTLAEHISGKKKPYMEKKSELLEEYEKQPEDIRLLTTKILIDKFNQKYSSLSIPQKSLLREYINNVSNSLRKYIDVQIPIIKKELAELALKVDDKVTKIKLVEVVKQIDSLSHGKIVRDEQVNMLLKYYSLIAELRRIL